MPQTPLILLVEDDPNDALLAGLALEKAGLTYELRHVRDGEEAINYLGGQPPYDDRKSHPVPALVLLDLKMPKISGFEVLSWLRNTPGITRIPVVVLTGSIQPEDRVQATSLGAAGFGTKPVDFSDLINLVRNLVPLWLPQSSRG
jgi:CheY-like chemotaxis protein